MRGPPELATLPEGAHSEGPLLRHAADHGFPIALSQLMYEEEKEVALRYGTHASTLKEAYFVHT